MLLEKEGDADATIQGAQGQGQHKHNARLAGTGGYCRKVEVATELFRVHSTFRRDP